MKKIVLTALFSLSLFLSKAQTAIDIEEGKTVASNGIEYSYAITNERTEDTYSRYEVTIKAQNKSGCQLIYLKNDNITNIFDGDPSVIARFECLNATGKRLTSKGANLKARPFTIPYNQPEKTADGKTTFRAVRVQGGFLLKNGSSVSNDLIVIVPKGERPRFKISIQNFSELTTE
ncbi:ABC transporter permease [Emticicia agri]|uniref:ABC transporter permease n=1 Tax=Emticicia agri TaxID=2492393 RepID=A0A4Q5M4W8_9BACT|nr:ABC transporter permease [Emticicia agri]RYU97526.1 ABC transporter permease [Emticicia agri]